MAGQGRTGSNSKGASRPPWWRGREPRPTPLTLTLSERQKVEAAVQVCAEILTDGWQEVVAERASGYATSETWQKLFQSHRRRRCRLLADIAKRVLRAKDLAHQLVGGLAEWIFSALNRSRLEQKFARELAKKIPLPQEESVVAAARGVQITGILLCLVNGDDLSRCQCFIDLALEQTKTALKNILCAALEDWRWLAQFPPKISSAASPA